MTEQPDFQPLLELAKRDSAEREHADATTRTPRTGVEIGSTGLEVFSGFLTGDIVEHNKDWQDKERYKVVDRMRRGDATCAAVLAAVTLPIVSTEFHVDAKEGSKDEKPDPVVEEAADFISAQLFDNDNFSWQQALREWMLYLAYGHYVLEKVFEVKDGMVGWERFAPRHPSTIERWNYNQRGRLSDVEQLVSSEAAREDQPVIIPASKLLVFTNNEEAGNVLGQSVLRAAYKHWRYKDGFYAVQAIAIERQGAGVPFAQYPPGTPDDELDKTEEMLQNIQAHEQSYFMFGEDWDVGFTSMGAQSVLNPNQAIEHHDGMIPKAVLAGFMNLPQDGRGSYALSSDASGFFNFSLQTSANYLGDRFTRDAIKEIVDLNWPGLHTYPRLTADRVGHLGVDQVLKAINESVKEGTITPDMDIENRVRDLLNLPAIDEADFEEAKEEEKEANAPPPAPASAGAPASARASAPASKPASKPPAK